MDIKNIKQIILANQKIFGITGNREVIISKLGNGLRNKNYLCKSDNKKFTARISVSKESNLAKEFKYLNLVKGEKIAPFPYLYKKLKDEEILFLEYIEGNHPQKMTKKRIVQLAELIAKLHAIKINSKITVPKGRCFQNLKNDILELYKKLEKKLNKSQISFIKNHLSKYIETVKITKNCIVHGDLHKQNLIVNKLDMKLIDFDCIGFSDNALEIVEIFQAFAFTKIQTELFLKTYNKITKDKSLQDRIDMFKPLKALFWYLWALEGIYFENRKDNFYQDEKMRAIQMINKIEGGKNSTQASQCSVL